MANFIGTRIRKKIYLHSKKLRLLYIGMSNIVKLALHLHLWYTHGLEDEWFEEDLIGMMMTIKRDHASLNERSLSNTFSTLLFKMRIRKSTSLVILKSEAHNTILLLLLKTSLIPSPKSVLYCKGITMERENHKTFPEWSLWLAIIPSSVRRRKPLANAVCGLSEPFLFLFL